MATEKKTIAAAKEIKDTTPEVKTTAAAKKPVDAKKTTADEKKPAAAKKPAVAEKTAEAAKKPAAKVKKTATAKKPAAAKKSAAAKKAEPQIYVQYMGREFEQKEIIDRIITKYESETGKKKSSIKTMDVYIKPEDNAAYYVINGQGDSISL